MIEHFISLQTLVTNFCPQRRRTRDSSACVTVWLWAGRLDVYCRQKEPDSCILENVLTGLWLTEPFLRVYVKL
jgi:hypothetical protein